MRGGIDTKRSKDRKVPHAYYYLRVMAGSDCYVLENQDGVWKTYFSERGNRFDEMSYASEDEACEAMFALITQRVWFSQHRNCCARRSTASE